MTILLCHRCQVPVTVPHYVTTGDGNCLCVPCAEVKLNDTGSPEMNKQKRGLDAIIGMWPGDETDEQIEQALAEMDDKDMGRDEDVNQLQEENSELRELLRWRKWPEEKPPGAGNYLVLETTLGDKYWCVEQQWLGATMNEELCRPFYWRHIGPLPESLE